MKREAVVMVNLTKWIEESTVLSEKHLKFIKSLIKKLKVKQKGPVLGLKPRVSEHKGLTSKTSGGK